MSKTANKLQLSTSLKNKYYIAKANGYCSNSPNGNGINQLISTHKVTIEQETNKPLRSASWVTTNNKSHKDWKYNNTSNYGVYRAVGNLWLCRDRQTKPEISECEREQIKLYRKLKREWEKEQTVAETTKETQLKTAVKQKAVKLLNGLACSPRYDRIYKAV